MPKALLCISQRGVPFSALVASPGKATTESFPVFLKMVKHELSGVDGRCEKPCPPHFAY